NKMLDTTKEFWPKLGAQLQNDETQLFTKMYNAINKFIVRCLYIVQPYQMADITVHLWKKYKIIRYIRQPTDNQLCTKGIINGSIQLYSVELFAIIFQFITCPFWIKVT